VGFYTENKWLTASGDVKSRQILEKLDAEA
jgi:hypothetical protein